MDGNRGAKGSIKDRLISMLYRLRYAKKVKKESEYELAKKEKQIEYLKKLLELQETENIDLLEETDKSELDKVKFSVNYKLDKDSFSIVDYELNEIESKTDELNEKVEIKEEIKKTQNEVVILDEVAKFVKESKNLLQEIDNEIEEIKSISKEKNQDTKDLEERYIKLREKVEKLKKQYDTAKDKYDLSEFSILESIKLIDNIKEYKDRANLNEMDMMIKVCKKEMDKIESVTIEYEKTEKVGEKIDNIKDDQIDIKIKFKKSKEKVEKLKKIESDINDELKKQEYIIDEMYKEASYFRKIVERQVTYKVYGNLFSSLLRIAGGILTLPFSGSKIFGIALGNTMINRGLKVLNQTPEKQENFVTRYEYTDIAHKISEVKDKVDYTNLIISDNLNEISKLKDKFKKYKEYNNVLNNYNETLEKIEKLEKSLKLQQQRISTMDKNLELEKEINKEKMKKVVLSRNNKE